MDGDIKPPNRRISLPNFWKLVLIVILGILSIALIFLGVKFENLYSIVAGYLIFAVFLISIVLSAVLFVVDRKYPAEKCKFRRGIDTTLFIVSSISLLLFFYYLVSLYPNALQFMKDGATAAISAVIGGLVVESILRLEKYDEIPLETTSNTEPDSTNQSTRHEAPESDRQIVILKEIRDILKETNCENRELSYAMFILSWVVGVATLVTIGNEIWRSYGWPLPILWIITPFLMFEGVWFFYCIFKKIPIIWCIGGVVIIGIIAVILTSASIGITLPSSPIGNVTNICENCSYPLTNIVNNYNITVTENCTFGKNPIVSIEEMKYLMGPKR
jgi:hypothetical protein